MTTETVFILATMGLACYFAYMAGKVVEGRKAWDRYEELQEKYIAAQRQIKY